uniref:ATP-binding cassette domain-containing protein n=1 Tax=Roseihalotalea indica TaxID=2867963 RepID=A0AA49JHT8_9BACT|nr:ATP-binding cassette domain-containing protein [Tunicatimonas sp. TK19036]
MTPPILHIQHLHKRYGKVHAVNDLSLEIQPGQVFGILGPNGSGKTTTLGIVLDVIKKNSGEYSWFGVPPSAASRKRIGAILESPIFYPYLSAVDNLKIVALIKDVAETRIDEVLKVVDLHERKNDAFKTYSLGMKQRLAIASALLADPEVMILDEPTNGLDPQGIAEIRELIVQIAQQGKTFILASHLLDEVQKVCSHFAVLKKGKLIYTGSVEEALTGTDTVEIAAEDMVLLEQKVQEFAHIESVRQEKNILRVRLANNQSSADLNRYLVEQGIVVSHLSQRTNSLEQQFLQILASSGENASVASTSGRPITNLNNVRTHA